MDLQTQMETTRFQFMAQLSSLQTQLQQAADLAERYHSIIQNVPNLGSMPAINFNANLPPIATQQHSGPGRKRKAQVEDEDELTDGRRRRRKKKERLPDQPKRPASAYLFFQNEVRNSLKELYPKTPHHELLGLISKQWADMSAENRKPYEDKQKVAKEQFDTQMTAFNLKHGIPPKAVKGAPAAQAAASDVASEDGEGEGEEIEASDPTSDVEDTVEPEVEEEDEEEEDEEEEKEPTPEPPKPVKAAKPPSKAVKEEKRPKKEKKSKA